MHTLTPNWEYYHKKYSSVICRLSGTKDVYTGHVFTADCVISAQVFYIFMMWYEIPLIRWNARLELPTHKLLWNNHRTWLYKIPFGEGSAKLLGSKQVCLTGIHGTGMEYIIMIDDEKPFWFSFSLSIYVL